jgi:general secretion pathway protein A
MYAPYFGLTQEPFSIAPDPRYLFMSERHREALAHLLYGLGAGGGFVLLTGEIGAGKTTVCRRFLEQMPANCNVAYIFNPKLTVTELLQSVCDEFHIPVGAPGATPRTVKDYLDPLNAFLLQAHAAGRNSVLIIDEAQNLSAEVLEQLRLLTNLETSERKLLQIILIGQPELREVLGRPELEQLAQRVIARYHLGSLTERETAHYVRHRLEVAGLARALPFEPKALARVHALSGGVPRRVNLLCDRAMLGAFANSEPAVNRRIVDQAAQEVFGAERTKTPAKWRLPAAVLVSGLVLGAGLMAFVRHLTDAPASSVNPSATGSAPEVPSPASAPAAAAAADSVLTAASAPSTPSGRSAPSASDVAASPATLAAASAASTAAQPSAQSPPPVLLRDQRQAWRELAQEWKVNLGEGDPCQLLAREQVQCFSRPTSVALIRQLGRPGIVTLDRDSTAPSYAVLTALTDKTATLRAGGTEQTVTLAALATRWQGDWATLWRAPVGYDSRAPQRMVPELTRWVQAQLPPVDSGKPLSARLRSFQLAQGLTVDGLLGPLTFMQLNRIAGVDEPRLRLEP